MWRAYAAGGGGGTVYKVPKVAYTFSPGSKAMTIALSPFSDTEVWKMEGPVKAHLDRSEDYNLRSPHVSSLCRLPIRGSLKLGRKRAFYPQSHIVSGSITVSLICFWMLGTRLFNILLTFLLSFQGVGR